MPPLIHRSDSPRATTACALLRSALALGLLAAASASAQAAATAPASTSVPRPLEEVVVRATRRPTSQADLDRSSTQLVVRDAAATETVTDLLRDAPSVFFQQTTPGQSTPIVRGLRGSQVLHLVDGIRLNNALFRDAPTQYVALVPLEGLEQVEVLPGAAPALYGADAIGGVVALRSRRPAFADAGVDARGRAQLAFSSADLRRVASVSGVVAGTGAALALGASDRSFGNRRVAGGDRVSSSGYGARSAFATARLAAADAHEIDVAFQWARQPSTPRVDELVAGFGQDAPASERNLFRPNARTMLRAGWRWRPPSRPGASLRLDLARQRITDDRLQRDTGATGTIVERNRSTLDGLVLQWTDRASRLGDLVGGLELYDDRVDSRRRELPDAGGAIVRAPRFLDGARVRSASGYVESRFGPGARGAAAGASVSLGLRATRYRIEFDDALALGAADTRIDADELTGRIGLRWRFDGGTTLFGSYGRGFRPPNVFDLGTFGARPGNRFNVPNTGLSPERSDSFEVGARFLFGDAQFTLALFAADQFDRIRSEETGALTDGGRVVVRNVNGGRSRFQGAEASMRWRPSDVLRVDALVGYVRGEDDFRGVTTPADRVPPVHARLLLARQLTGTLATRVIVDAASRQDRLSARDVRDPRIDPSGTDAWVRLDADARWSLREGLVLRMTLGNLADASYREHGSGIDAPGRHLALAIDWQP